MSVAITITVNSVERQLEVSERQSLADFLRQELQLTGTHLGCEHGVCGACTVLVDGASSRSCLMLAAQADGTHVTTIEGLAQHGELHPVQRGFLDCHSFQCGFCTPGFIMATVELLREIPAPTESEVRAALSGNICRCTGYQSIVQGVLHAAEELK